MDTEGGQVGWRLWLAWLVLTIVGAELGEIINDLPMMVFAIRFPQTVVSELLIYAWLGAAVGASVGFCQWPVLRKQVSRAAWWIPVSMVAGAVGAPLSQTLGYLFSVNFPSAFVAMWLLAAAISGSVWGGIESLFFRARVPRSELWVLAFVVVSVLNMAITMTASLTEPVKLLVHATIGGAITGAALIIMLREPRGESAI